MSEAAFPRGPQRPAASDIARLTRRLSDLERLLHAALRTAPMAVSGVHMYPTGMTVESALDVTGTTTLGTSTSIAGVGMNTFITTTQATTAEVDASHSGHPNLKSKIDAINAKAEDALSDASAVQSEVTSARGGHGNLDARLDTLASTSALGAYATDAEVTAALNSLSSQLDTAFGVVIGHINTLANLHSLGPFPAPWGS